MRKIEIVSLVMVVAAIVGLVVAFQMEIGSLRFWTGWMAIGLLFLSIKPPFPRRLKQEENRVGRAVGWFFLGLLGVALVAMLVAPFFTDIDEKTPIIIIDVVVGLILLLVVLSFFTAHGWLSRRLKWLTGSKPIQIVKEEEGKASMQIFKEGKGKEKMLYTNTDKDGISYGYRPSERQFFIHRTMFLNPNRYEKEYGERKYQFQARLGQTHIPLALWVPDCKSILTFGTSVILKKQDATKDNVCHIRDVIRDLAKEDFDQHLYSRFIFGDDTLYLETFHYQLIWAVLVRADGNVERYSPKEESDEPSERLNEIFQEISKEGWLDKLQPENLIDENEFKRIWNTHEQRL